VFSAFGMLFSDLRYDYVRTCMTSLASVPFEDVVAIYEAMEAEGQVAITDTSIDPRDVTIKRAADMRYVGQEHAVTVDLPLSLFERQDREGIKRCFDEMHELRYGTSAPKEAAEIVSLRSTVIGVIAKPPLEPIGAGTIEPPTAAHTGRRKVYFNIADGFVDTPTYARGTLLKSNRIVGPALIEEHASTTVLMPGDVMTVDGLGNLIIAVGEG
jgi:N-methylhydantoinase A